MKIKHANKTSRSVLALLLVCVMAFALAACGKKDTGALSKEEYKKAVEDMGTAFSDVQTKASSLDINNADAKDDAIGILKECKQPLEEFVAVVAPEEYKEGHEKLKSGCQAMIESLDAMIEAAGADDPSSKLAEVAGTITEKMTTAATDMAEGAKLLQDAGLEIS